jgi:tRNA threonylcarbamoyladenosine biosynthesis protein TsaE
MKLDAGPQVIALKDEAETGALGQALAERLSVGDVVYLKGDLGSGKSTLARALIRALTHADQEVPSPTFTLIQTYEGQGGLEIAHLDLYRLKTPDEAHEIGVFELQPEALTLIEWPENLGYLGFDDHLEISLDRPEDKAEGQTAGRIATLTPMGAFRYKD